MNVIFKIFKREGGSDPLLYLSIFVFAIILIGTGTVMLFRSRSSDLVLSSIDVSGNRYLSKEEILALSELKKGMKIETPLLSRSVERIQLNPVIADVEIERYDGGKILIRVVEKKCAAVLFTDDRLYDIDEALQILSVERVRCVGVPVVSGRFMKKGDHFLDPVLSRALDGWRDAVRRYPDLKEYISQIHIHRSGGLRLFGESKRLQIEMSGELDRKGVDRLHAALFYFEKENRPSGRIDLRGGEALVVP